MARSLRLIKHVRIDGTITCLTGLRIGGSKEDVEIGGTENPILRDPLSKFPYIPGSSIKGKLRSLLELRYCPDKVQATGEPCGCAEESCLVCTVFGPHKKAEHGLGPSRILVRDAPLSEASRERLSKLQEEGILSYAETKAEVTIDRRTGVALRGGLRTQERVPAGAVFNFSLALRIFESDDPEELIGLVDEGLRLLESEYLGGSGSRGYGQVKLEYEITR